jgi:hypothetical protein
MSKFSITDRKGFQMTFANGYTVSVQFGYGNYSENRNDQKFGEDAKPSATAEFAAWDADGTWVRFDGECDDVIGYLTTDQALARINEVASL